MRSSHPPIGREIELAALALEKLWALTNTSPLNTDFVPQADNLDLLYQLVRVRLPDVVSGHDIARAFDLHGRHAAYCLEAACRIEILTQYSRGLFVRSSLGTRIGNSNEPDSYRLFITTVLRLPVILRLLVEFRSAGPHPVGKSAIEEIVRSASGGRYSGTTVARRANTVISWMLWLENNVWFTSGR